MGLVCLTGLVEVYIQTLDQNQHSRLNSPTKTLLLEPSDWRVMHTFSPYAMLMVIADQFLWIRSQFLQLVEGKHCIVGKRMKTGTDYYIPVSERMWALLDKYNEVMMPLPKLGDYNPLLRQIMLSLGIDKRITSHTARKTFADWCINELSLTEEATIVANVRSPLRN